MSYWVFYTGTRPPVAKSRAFEPANRLCSAIAAADSSKSDSKQTIYTMSLTVRMVMGGSMYALNVIN